MIGIRKTGGHYPTQLNSTEMKLVADAGVKRLNGDKRYCTLIEMYGKDGYDKAFGEFLNSSDLSIYRRGDNGKTIYILKNKDFEDFDEAQKDHDDAISFEEKAERQNSEKIELLRRIATAVELLPRLVAAWEK